MGKLSECVLTGMSDFIYDQVAKPLSCTDEFAYDHPYQAKTDIYFHICKNKGHGGGQNNF